MEKGNTKNSTKPTDNKQKQDVSNKHLRLPRVKDVRSPRPDARRISNPQKNRELFDKRPRDKNGSMYEYYRSKVTQNNELSSEHGCIKKANLNHLLNFTFPVEVWEGNSTRPSYNKPRQLKHPKYPKYNKELFLQANCQFVVRDHNDYTVHQNNPDKLVEWSWIEEVRLPCLDVPSCPICLHIPIAAKITRCGHVFCWPCILHFLVLTDKTWQKCPICFEAVHKSDLKSVLIKFCKSFAVENEITLCLMKREKGSLISVPVSFEKPSHLMCTVTDVNAVTRYQKLLLASKKEVYAILERERMELKAAYEEEKDTPEVCFIESALSLLLEREILLNQSVDITKGYTLNAVNADKQKLLFSTSSTESSEEKDITKSLACEDFSENLNSESSSLTLIPEADKKGVIYFYQAEDGQHIYLHNINVRMLLKEFGSLESAPEAITAKLVEMERVSMNDVLRKRLRYLQHLPLTCEFNIVELEFSNVVTKATLSLFENEIIKRKQIRNRKARDERRREKMIEREENRKLGIYPKATYNLSSTDQFPAYNPDDFPSSSPPKAALKENKDIPETNFCFDDDIHETPSSSSDTVPLEASCIPTTSFAQMLKIGSKNFTHAVKETKTALQSNYPDKNSGEESDEGNPAPEFHRSFSDAIEAALNAVTIQDCNAGVKDTSKKKKKGKKQQLLFTTSMCRNK